MSEELSEHRKYTDFEDLLETLVKNQLKGSEAMIASESIDGYWIDNGQLVARISRSKEKSRLVKFELMKIDF
jgi:hypothetical protein